MVFFIFLFFVMEKAKTGTSFSRIVRLPRKDEREREKARKRQRKEETQKPMTSRHCQVTRWLDGGGGGCHRATQLVALLPPSL